MKKTIAVLSLIAIFAAATSMSAQTTPVKEKAKTEKKACCKDEKSATCKKDAKVGECCKGKSDAKCSKDKKAACAKKM
jgi:hypothetical protein